MDYNTIKESNQTHDEKYKDMGFSTKCTHIGQEPDPIYGGVNVPINLSTTYAQTYPNVPFGPFDYSRCGNPTRDHLERLIAGLYSAKYSISWSSGMAATTGLINMLCTGDEVICMDDMYGGTQRYFRRISQINHNIKYKFINMNNYDVLKSSLSEKTRLIWLESPTNPTLKVTDIRTVVKMVKEFNKDIIIVVDNTFLSPYNCNPLSLGADFVMESATKYLGGHSDIVMGCTATNDDKLQERLFFISKTTGGVPSPFDCYMAIRSIKTLSIRVERQNQNGLILAQYLNKHPKIEKCMYPGLETDEFHQVAKNQQKGFGGVLSLVITGGLEKAANFLTNLKVFTLAESLGSVESLADHPALMTHASVPEDIRKELGVVDGFVRLSCGIEDVEDLLNDVKQALEKI
jgi:cystathionine gamma-lyase